jgi:hypothetical protein
VTAERFPLHLPFREMPMKIVSVTSKVFTYRINTARDSDGHSHPGPERDTTGALLTIACDDGTSGHRGR